MDRAATGSFVCTITPTVPAGAGAGAPFSVEGAVTLFAGDTRVARLAGYVQLAPKPQTGSLTLCPRLPRCSSPRRPSTRPDAVKRSSAAAR